MRHAPTLIMLAFLFLLPVAVLVLQAGAPGWRFPELWPELSFDGLGFLAARPKPFLTALASSLGYSLATVGVGEPYPRPLPEVPLGPRIPPVLEVIPGRRTSPLVYHDRAFHTIESES